jgi:tRNA A37 threonylcarbamoyladenosine dehydratase
MMFVSRMSRQIHALTGELGKPKPEVMERRVKAINPDCRIRCSRSFLKSTAEEILQQGFDFVDAIDDSDMKCLLISAPGTRSGYLWRVCGPANPTAIR